MNPCLPPVGLKVRAKLVFPWGDELIKIGTYYDTPQRRSPIGQVEMTTQGFITIEPVGIGVYDPKHIVEWESLE